MSFFVSLAILITLIAVLAALSSVVQKWVSDEARYADKEDQPPDQKGKKIDEKDGNADDGQTGWPANAVADAINAYHSKRDTHERRKSQSDKVTVVILSVTAFFALVAAGVGGISDWIIYGQLREMKSSRIDSTESTAKQIAILSDEAQSLRGSLLPRVRYVIAQNPNITTKIFEVTPTWSNEGPTDASDFYTWDDLNIFSSQELALKADFSRPLHGKTKRATFSVGPGESITNITQNLPGPVALKAIQNEAFPVVWGYAEYNDEFGSRYKVTFCFLLEFVLVNSQPGAGNVVISAKLPAFWPGVGCNKRERMAAPDKNAH